MPTRFQSTRGQLLSIFGVVSMGSWATGQALLNIAPPADVTLFLIVSLLISAAVVPITLLPSHPPADVRHESVAFRDLFSVSPLASIGVFLAGLAIGGFWGMGPNFAQRTVSTSPASPPSWPQFSEERLRCNGRSVGSPIGCPGTLVIAGAALASAVAAIGVSVAARRPSARPPCGGSALRRFWHPDLFAVSRRRERRPSSRAAARHRARASAAQRNRNGGRTTCRGSGDGSCRARWAVRLCCCPADHASGVSGPTRSLSLRNRGKGDTLSEYADDHRLSMR